MAKVKRKMLVWARGRAGFSIDEAAKKLFKDSKKATATQKLQALEGADSELVEVSNSKLAKMASLYRRPIITFYLSSPPKESEYGEDFRANIGADDSQDALVKAMVRQVKASQSIIKEALLEFDEDIVVPFIGSIDMERGVKFAVDRIIRTTKFDLGMFRQARNNLEAFKFLRSTIEDTGVFVILKGNLSSHHTNIDAEFFRGFAIADKVAPFIVINDLDQSSAYSFTLLHELTHLFLGKSGISNNSVHVAVENFCNEVASEILLPETDFQRFKLSKSDTADQVEAHISEYSQATKVSCTHIALRLYRRGDITSAQYSHLAHAFYRYWQEAKATKKASRQEQSGPNPYIVARYKLGALVRQVERLTKAGILSPSKAGIATNTRAINVFNLFDAA